MTMEPAQGTTYRPPQLTRIVRADTALSEMGGVSNGGSSQEDWMVAGGACLP
jgi:hypothetical protein